MKGFMICVLILFWYSCNDPYKDPYRDIRPKEISESDRERLQNLLDNME